MCVFACLAPVRKWKIRTKLGGERDWEYEIGEAPVRVSSPPSRLCTRTHARDSTLSISLSISLRSLLPRSESSLALGAVPVQARVQAPVPAAWA